MGSQQQQHELQDERTGETISYATSLEHRIPGGVPTPTSEAGPWRGASTSTSIAGELQAGQYDPDAIDGSTSSSRMAVNLNEEPWPPSDVHGFFEESTKLWLAGTVGVAAAVAFLSYFRLNLVFSVLVVVVGSYSTRSQIESLKHQFVFDTERQRGERAREGAKLPESVEWLNFVVKAIWPTLDPSLFVAGVDLLEDALKAQAPSIVRTVRVSSLEQGTNAMRLCGIKAISEQDFLSYTRKQTVVDLSSIPADVLEKLPKEKPTEEEPGVYLHFECEFSYRKKPPPAREGNGIHLLVHMGIGMKKVGHVELPVFTELAGAHGKILLRIQTTPDPPFVKHVTFTFPRLPAIEIAARPLKIMNVMQLPLVAPYILKSVNTVVGAFVSPRSYTIDLSRFFLGSDVEMKTKSTGIVVVVVHRALGLAKSDMDGHSDPYFAVSLSNQAKVLYTSRCISNCLNPVFEEIAFVRVSEDDFEENQRVRINILDHDRFSADDNIGSVEYPLAALKALPGIFERRTDPLRSVHRGTKAEGSLTFSIAFFPLTKVVAPKSLATAEAAAQEDMVGDATLGTTSPKKRGSTKPKPVFADRTQQDDSRSGAYAQRMREMLDGKRPANSAQKSGILAFQVHQLLELETPRRLGTKESKEGKDTVPPSSFVRVFINDEKAFQTRTQPFSSNPYFNAGSEWFCRDWTRTRIDFVVMDAKNRDHDELLGVVSFELADTFKSRSQLTTWMPLVGTDSVGRFRVSLLFKAIDISLPRQLSSWNVGTLEISQLQVVLHGSTEFFGKVELNVEFGGSASTESAGASPAEHGEFISTDDYVVTFDLVKPIRLAVLNMHVAPMILQLRSVSNTLQRKKDVAMGVVWLSDIMGLEGGALKVPMMSYVTDWDEVMREPDSLPLPTLLTFEKDKKAKSPDAVKPSPPAAGPTVVVAKQPSKPSSSTLGVEPRPSHARRLSDAISIRSGKSSSSATENVEVGIATAQVRWVPGIGHAHRDVVLGSSPEVRQAYRLWLLQKRSSNFKTKRPADSRSDAKAPKRSSPAKKQGMSTYQSMPLRFDEPETVRRSPPSRSSSVNGSPMSSLPNSRRSSLLLRDSGDEDAGQWVEEEEEALDTKWYKRKQVRGLGSVKWISEGARVATHKLKRAGKHKVQGPSAEEELISSL